MAKMTAGFLMGCAIVMAGGGGWTASLLSGLGFSLFSLLAGSCSGQEA